MGNMRKQVVIRMQDQEIVHLEELAKRAGVTKSELVRDLVRRCAVQVRPVVVLEAEGG